jgi:hypothetical protein
VEGHIPQAHTSVQSEAPRDAYTENARINARKEATLLGRAPTQEGAKKTNGGDEFGEVQHQKLESDRVNQRGMGNAAPQASNRLEDPEHRIGRNTKTT